MMTLTFTLCIAERNNSSTCVTTETETMTSDSSHRKLGCSTSRCTVEENSFQVSVRGYCFTIMLSCGFGEAEIEIEKLIVFCI